MICQTPTIQPSQSTTFKHQHTCNNLQLGISSALTKQVDRSKKKRAPFEVVREKFNHHPQPLNAAQQADFTRILSAAYREIGGSL